VEKSLTAAFVGVVCIGSSAGGLASLKAIVRALPAGFRWPILVTQHFPADVTSHLPEILARESALAVREALQGERLAPGVLLTCPSSAVMGVSTDGAIMLRPRKGGLPDSVDHLFTTAAGLTGAKVVAVVLSGAGWDGAAGATIVKKNGGTVIAESPETAEWGGMPAAAISAGAVEQVLPNHAIAAALTVLATARPGAENPHPVQRGVGAAG
jgi:two-component system chemotaxis response regulator CheB